uniref:Uncharacterized protein n=1 Tax=Oryza meridionalis TaxID=40149 RepID=A0A0E0E7G5_9ORYZ
MPQNTQSRGATAAGPSLDGSATAGRCAVAGRRSRGGGAGEGERDGRRDGELGGAESSGARHGSGGEERQERGRAHRPSSIAMACSTCLSSSDAGVPTSDHDQATSDY